MARDVIIIGGGISGLSLLYFLRAKNVDALLLEQAPRVGGSIRSERVDGFLIERGPNTTAMSNMALFNLIQGAGLELQLQLPLDISKKRFIVKASSLIPLPMSFGSFVGTRLFSAKGKLTIINEPFVKRGTDPDESVGSFFARRFGADVAEYAVKPFISGIYAGDATQLAMRTAFPSVYDIEQKYGSVIGGFIKKSRDKAPQNVRPPKPPNKGKSISFDGGLEALPLALHALMSDRIVTGAHDIAITQYSSQATVKWNREHIAHSEETAKIVISAPAYAASELFRGVNENVSAALANVPYASVAIAHLGFRRTDISHPLDGFGFLVPPCENKQVLGCLFSSSLFAGRAPEGQSLLTVFLGGSRNPAMLQRSDDEIKRIAIDELTSLVGLHGDPVMSLVTKIARAIPQYTVPYLRAMETVNAFESATPNIFFCNNFKGGISIGDCVQNAAKMAEMLS